MKRLFAGGAALALLLAACTPAPEPASAAAPDAAPIAAPDAAPARARDARRIHAVIVGIDRYRFSDARQPGAVFPDLRGAVGDARRFKQALAELYGVDVDVSGPDACESSNAATTTLTDDCATRARILEALENRVAGLRPGDTLLFYFAGHGSRYRDDRARDQDTGYNGTILPTDARSPDGAPGDIFDVELKALKDRATAAGLYFVSVFDSCNSATATRAGASGLSRNAPPLAVAAPQSPASASASAPAPAQSQSQSQSQAPEQAQAPAPAQAPAAVAEGYWVHLAAAQDGEEAQETGAGSVGERAGVFTTALVDALRLPGMRDATFGDLIHEVRLRVAARGHGAQTPSAEGALTAAFGARSRVAVLFDAQAAAGAITLQAGHTSGITPGSRFALYASQADAIARRPALATASVTDVGAATATLVPDAPVPGAASARLVAEQIAHFLPAETLGVAIDLPPGAAREAAQSALRATGFAVPSDTGATRLVAAQGETGAVALRADDGTVLAPSLGAAEDPAFATRLADALRKVARVQQLLALRTNATPGADADPYPISACVAPDGYRPTACPALQPGGVRRIGPGEKFTATVTNRGARPAYVYVLAIDPRNAVDLVLPKPGEFDQPLAPNRPYRREGMAFDTPGAYRFVVLASATPIRADAFQQSGTGARDLGACTTPLERLLCASSEGQRDVGVAAVGDWSAHVTTVLATTEGTQ